MADLSVTKRVRRVRCKLCLESREVEVDTWDDRVEPTFAHDCKGKGPKLSHPATRDGACIKFFPIGKRVAIQRLPPEEVMGGIIVPDAHQQPAQFATVLAAGPLAQGILDDAGVRIGDTISFGKYTGVTWEWQPQGTESVTERRAIETINVDDIQGCMELAERLYTGEVGLQLYRLDDGSQEYRFFERMGKKPNEG